MSACYAHVLHGVKILEEGRRKGFEATASPVWQAISGVMARLLPKFSTFLTPLSILQDDSLLKDEKILADAPDMDPIESIPRLYDSMHALF